MSGKLPSIAVAGAGSIGCYAGGCLALAGRDVTLLARSRVADAIRSGGLHVSDLEGRRRTLKADALAVATDPSVLAGADVVLVTVKSRDTVAMAKLIAAHASQDAVVVSLQNGVENPARLRAELGRRRVIAGMVPFNIVQSDERLLRLYRASGGTVLIEAGNDVLRALLDVEGFAVAGHADMQGVLWGKLLMNLNNALVALSGLPLAVELADRRWRMILRAQIIEALAALKAAKIVPAAVAGLPPSLLPVVLRLPDWLFRRLAHRMLAIDPEARSSMWDDLQRRRPTEIDDLQGAVVTLARQTGVETPFTERVVGLVHEAESRRQGSPGLRPDQVTL